MNKKYTYFVSYFGYIENDPYTGFGMCEVSLDNPIKTYSDILKMSELIKRKNNFDDVVVINYKEVESEDY